MDENVFRAYDIRGRVGIDFDEDFFYRLGLAIGNFLKPGPVSVSRDVRMSGEKAKQDIIKGLFDAGREVIDLGMNPTPVMYFSIQKLRLAGGVQVTASHLPPEWNGVKINDDEILPVDSVGGLMEIKEMMKGQMETREGGIVRKVDIKKDYAKDVSSRIKLERPLKILIDNGNGSVGLLGEEIMELAGAKADTLFADFDDSFPNHLPDPHKKDSMKELQKRVSGYDFGVAFDGDGDRAGFVDSSGRIIPEDKLIMLFAEDALRRKKGKVVVEVRTSMAVIDFIKSIGGEPVMAKAGRSFIARVIRGENAVWGGETTGHFFFPLDYYMFDDGIFAAAKLAEIWSRWDVEERIDSYPEYFASDEISIKVDDTRKWDMVDKAKEILRGKADRIIDIDGVRAEWENGWLLIRASNTGPKIKARFEAKTEDFYQELESMLKDILEEIGASE